MINLL